MLVVMESKFVVTKTASETAKRKERKIEVFAKSGHLRFSLSCDLNKRSAGLIRQI